MIDTGLNLTSEAEVLVKALIAVMGLVFVLMTAARTRAVVPTVGAIVFAGLVGWAVANTDFIEQKVDEDIRGALGNPTAVVADA